MSKKEEKGKGVVISIVIIAAIVLIILGIAFLKPKPSLENDMILPNESAETGTEQPAGPTEHIVEITNEGFVPKTLEIKQGDKVTWVNKLVTKVRPAGNFHPTHTVYPGSSITKCGTAAEKEAFDACRELQNGESYSFVFNEIGSWGYHNHLEPSKSGKIIVS